jgi:hypothetical protein
MGRTVFRPSGRLERLRSAFPPRAELAGVDLRQLTGEEEDLRGVVHPYQNDDKRARGPVDLLVIQASGSPSFLEDSRNQSHRRRR